MSYFAQGYRAYHENECSLPPLHIPKERHDEWRRGWMKARDNYVDGPKESKVVSLGYVMFDDKGNRVTAFIHTEEEIERWIKKYAIHFPNKKITVKEIFYND